MGTRPSVRLVIAAALSALAASALAAAPPAQAATSVTSLARGPAPHATYLRNGVIHPPHGDRIRVQVAKGARPSLQLLGRTPAGWAVVRGSDDLLMVTADSTTRVARVPDWGPFTNSWYLSRDRSRVLLTAEEDQAGLRLTVLGLDGQTQGDRMFSGYPEVLDFTGPSVVLAGGTTRVWTPGHGVKRLVARRSTYARWDDDLLFVGGAASGPTSLQPPGRPPWTTRLQPVGVSPSGRRILAVDDPSVGGVQRYAVLSRSTGHVLSSWRLPHRYGVVLRWENNHAVLIGIDTTRGQTLLRCNVHGSCERTLGWSARVRQTQVPISVPFDYVQGPFY
jgi:hypothetical protein